MRQEQQDKTEKLPDEDNRKTRKDETQLQERQSGCGGGCGGRGLGRGGGVGRRDGSGGGMGRGGGGRGGRRK